jgi:hypothetical protein
MSRPGKRTLFNVAVLAAAAAAVLLVRFERVQVLVH